jgi:ribose/xylose/arabinose/galactoside ABC-type transport system permease subunit
MALAPTPAGDGLLITLLILCVYLSFSSQYFLQYQNILNITEAMAVVGIAAAFATVVVIGGGIDLTPVTVMVVADRVPARAERRMPVPVVVLIALAASVRDRLVNGALIALLTLNLFIVTLGTNFLFTGSPTSPPTELAAHLERAVLQDRQSQLPGRIPVSTAIMIGVFVLASSS